MKSGFNRPNGLEIFENGSTGRRRTPARWVTISSASKPNSSGELKISEFFIWKLPFLVFSVMKNYRINSQCVMMWLLLWHPLNFHI